MTERAARAFPFVLAALLPLVGLILALVRFAEKRPGDGVLLVAASVLGAAVYALVVA